MHMGACPAAAQNGHVVRPFSRGAKSLDVEPAADRLPHIGVDKPGAVMETCITADRTQAKENSAAASSATA